MTKQAKKTAKKPAKAKVAKKPVGKPVAPVEPTTQKVPTKDGYIIEIPTEKLKDLVALEEFEIAATIPTVQYGNLQPKYKIKATSFKEAEKAALPYIEKLWAQYCQKGSELQVRKPVPAPAPAVSAPATVTETSQALETLSGILTPSKAKFDRENHIYYNDKNEKYLGGSTFSKKFIRPFDKAKILPDMEKKFGIPAAEIEKLWNLKGEVSSGFGTALHAALEMYGKYKDVGEVLGANKKPAVNTALHDHPIILKIVQEFFKGREKEEALYEEFVSDEKNLFCGRLDRVLIVSHEKRIVRIQDFKFNADINRKGFNGKLLAPFDNLADTPLNGYWIQLSFYAELFKRHGWTVEAMDIFAYDDKWTTYTREPIDLSKVI